jgi:hypothetical protein
MLPPVVQDVDERIPHFPWRAKEACMIPVAPEPATPRQALVDRPGDSDREAAHTALETRRPVRFRDQVHVISLDTDMEDPVNTCPLPSEV